ncbi:hydroxyacylglutathione hydrolase [Aestuariibius sp. HNIBRBA575]|uniref:hydroxyacylglutathione hydrolase n=1 Tax=Aestuariibius sp. HNIBRBA575 TaxID=3233343 RepID=UPI0034A1E6A0
MPLTLLTIPCLSDNYAFLVHNDATGETALVDAPESEPILAALADRNWTLTDILLTHHHWDHVDGLGAIRNATGARVIGAAADAERLPPLDLAVTEGHTITVCGEAVHIFDVSGHTIGHIAFHFPDSSLAFTADSLMALGCGRLFEGTPAQMWESLQKLRALPAETLICSGHEYTASNAKFALSIDPNNTALIERVADITAKRAAGEFTVPSTLQLEQATNPFLRADANDMKAAIGMDTASDVEVFTEIRARKDNF